MSAGMNTLEPELLSRLRRAAWDDFASSPPPPATSETWRRGSFSAWGTDSFHPGMDGSCEAVFSGPSGVEISSLDEAVLQGGQAVLSRFGERDLSPDFTKLDAANRALWRGGVSLRVPRGVRIDEPIRITFRHDPAKPFQAPRILVVLEEGSRAVVVEEHVSLEGASIEPSRSLAFSQIFLERGSSLKYVYTQELNRDSLHLWSQSAFLSADAEFDHSSILLGGRLHKSRLDVVLAGRGAKSSLRGALLGGGEQLFDPETRQLHRASNSTSDLKFRAVLRDRARSIYTGLIRVEPDALDCEAFQENRNLILSDQARADSTPVLEILPDRVRCKHAATAGPLDPGQMFYLASRGIPESEAAEMLIMGFFEPVIEQVPFDDLRERLRAAVAAGARS